MAQYTSGGDGRVGFINIGNTCYMSAVFQCLAHTDPLRHYMLSQPIEQLVNWGDAHSVNGWTAFYFSIYMRQVWSNKFSSVRYKSLKETMGRFNREFSANIQCDAQELLTSLLDNLHNDLAREDFQLLIGAPNHDNLHSEATNAWLSLRARSDSVIVDLFYYQSVKTITCGDCAWPRYRFEPTTLIGLNLQESRRKDSVYNLLDEFVKKHPSDAPMTCEVCSIKSISQVNVCFWNLPPILILHLMRNVMDAYTGANRKIETHVDYPTVLDMTKYCHKENQQNVSKLYDLFGMVLHVGGAGQGHYTAIARTSHGAKGLSWRRFDDNCVEDIKESDKVLNSKFAYLLFYRRRS